MKNLIVSIVIGLFVTGNLIGQQSDEIRFNFDNQYINNPAALSLWGQSEASVYYQKNFTGVPNAPQVFYAGYQTAVPYQGISAGIALIGQRAGVIQNTAVQLSTSYKIFDLIKYGDYLAGGIGVNFSHLSIASEDIIVSNPQDPIIIQGFNSAISSNINFGVLYSTLRVLDNRRPKTSYQFGASVLRTIPQRLNLTNLDYRERYYFGGLIGATMPFNEDFSMRGQLELQFEGSSLWNGILSTEMKFANMVLAGLSFDKFNTVGLSVGCIIADLFSDETELRVSLNGNLTFGNLDHYVNSGYGIGIQYRFNGNNYDKF